MIEHDTDEERVAQTDRLVEALKRKPFVLKPAAPGWTCRRTAMKAGLLLVLLLIPRLVSAQPLTLTCAWDAASPDQNVLYYTVTLDGVIVGMPSGTTQTFTLSPGLHTLAVTATNDITTSSPTTLQLSCTATTCATPPQAPSGLAVR